MTDKRDVENMDPKEIKILIDRMCEKMSAIFTSELEEYKGSSQFFLISCFIGIVMKSHISMMLDVSDKETANKGFHHIIAPSLNILKESIPQ